MKDTDAPTALGYHHFAQHDVHRLTGRLNKIEGTLLDVRTPVGNPREGMLRSLHHLLADIDQMIGNAECLCNTLTNRIYVDTLQR